MSSLFSRLSILFTAILLVLGVMIWTIAHQSQQRYFEETTQQLNRPVAMYIAEQIPLFTNGHYDHTALSELARHVMIINPSLELYLLDANGQVVASALEEGREQSIGQLINLSPIKAFLDSDIKMPIYGEDPLNPEQLKIFSAFPLSDSGIAASNCSPCGYVYAVLGGEHFSSGLQALKSSPTFQFATMMLLAVLLCALLAGLVIFFMLTRPLRAMTESMSQWELVASGGYREFQRQDTVSQRYRVNELETLKNTCHEMAERLSKQFAELDDVDRQRRQLLTSLSHDLRTPLTSVCGALETLIAKSATLTIDERAAFLNMANRQAGRLHRMIDQVFELARLDSNDVSLELEPVSFQELAMDTVQELAPQAAIKFISLRFISADTEQEHLINGDLAQLNRVLVNLLSNALRHTPEHGSVVVQTCVNSAKKMRVTITDSGCGFSSKLNHQPMSSISSTKCVSNGVGFSGTGLGLGIVSRILQLHDSEATICSAPGKGTRITFSLHIAVKA